MSDLVASGAIDAIVGARRHATKHYARAVWDEQKVYILHSKACRSEISDPRDCPFSRALDRGIDAKVWPEDVAVEVSVRFHRLWPGAAVVSGE